MENKAVYKEIIEKIVKSKIKVFGVAAIKKLGGVTTVKFDSEGNVLSMSGKPMEIISLILSKFEEISGKTSTINCRSAIRKIVEENPGLELPPQLLKE